MALPLNCGAFFFFRRVSSIVLRSFWIVMFDDSVAKEQTKNGNEVLILRQK